MVSAVEVKKYGAEIGLDFIGVASADPISLTALGKILRNQESMIRAHAAWAIGRIGGSKAKQLLLSAFRKEKEPNVKKEIDNALQNLT